jgi:hypothetical protein
MTKDQAEKWLFENRSDEGSPEFERVFEKYKSLAGGDQLKAAENEYAKVEGQPDSAAKLARLDALRTKIENLGGTPKLSNAPMVTQGEEPQDSQVGSQKDSGLMSQADFNEYIREARLAQLGGGAAGALRYAPNIVGAVAGPTLRSLSQSAEEGRMRARPPAQPPVQSALPTPTGTASSPLGQSTSGYGQSNLGGYSNQTVLDRTGAVIDPRAPNQPTMYQADRQRQGTIKEPGTRYATTGRASQTGYLAQSKELSEAEKEARAILERVRNNPKTPPLPSIPRGITASTASGIVAPAAALEPLPPPQIGAAGVEPRLGAIPPEGPYVNPQTLRALPATTTAPPPVASGLDQVRATFNRMANTPIGQGVSRTVSALGTGARALGTIGAGSEVGLNLYDMVKALEDEKYGRAAMSAGKAAAMGASIMTPYGLIPAALLYGADYLNDAQSRANMKALHGMNPQRAYESEGGFYSANQ